ncbi:MAG: hypothetical protein WEE53_14185, partial [Acidimicrobiia bacterium]
QHTPDSNIPTPQNPGNITMMLCDLPGVVAGRSVLLGVDTTSSHAVISPLPSLLVFDRWELINGVL